MKLRIAKRDSHIHGDLIFTNVYSQWTTPLIQGLEAQFQIGTINRVNRKHVSKGIDANELNLRLRDNLVTSFANANVPLLFEVYLEDGLLRWGTKRKKGFDFATFDQPINLARLRNRCFGRTHYHDGKALWKNHVEESPERFAIAKRFNLGEHPLGKDIDVRVHANPTPTILGEIQFGNWALAKHDFLKATAANNDVGVDLFVYVCPTGDLENQLSEGIVTFDKAIEHIRAQRAAIGYPVAIIGLDITNN